MTLKYCKKCSRLTCCKGFISFCSYCGANIAGEPELEGGQWEILDKIASLKSAPAQDKNGQLKLFLAALALNGVACRKLNASATPASARLRFKRYFKQV